MHTKLHKVYLELSTEDQSAVLAFAEFLQQRVPAKPQEVETPNVVVRPEKETVVAAIKRLSLVYSMIDRGAMMNETSKYMTEHVLNGRPAKEVIDDIEVLFETHYDRYVQVLKASG
jgi:hypothetical protein